MHSCDLYLLQVQPCSCIAGKPGSGYWRPGKILNSSTMWQNCSCTLRGRRFPALEGKWEARTLQGPHYHIHQSATQVPHIMLPCQPHKTLQELVEQWAYDQDTGQVCAISEAPTFLCIQLLRFQGNMGGEVSKLSHPTPLSPKLQVPTFSEGINTRPQAYVLHSVVYHLGCTPDSGHYRTMGITAPKGEPSSLQEAFLSELTRSLNGGAAHPALHVQNDETLRRWRLPL